MLNTEGKLDEAVAAYRQAIRVKPDYVEAYYNLGNALKDQDELAEAVAAYRRAIGIKADYAETYSNLGVALNDRTNMTRRSLHIVRRSASSRTMPRPSSECAQGSGQAHRSGCRASPGDQHQARRLMTLSQRRQARGGGRGRDRRKGDFATIPICVYPESSPPRRWKTAAHHFGCARLFDTIESLLVYCFSSTISDFINRLICLLTLALLSFWK